MAICVQATVVFNFWVRGMAVTMIGSVRFWFAQTTTGPIIVLAGMLILAGLTQTLSAKTPIVREIPIEELRNKIGSLSGVKPLQADLSAFVVDKLAAQQLGKALFWDTQVGSDGNACASCHFHAGADIRVQNQVNPGLKSGDQIFNQRASGPGPSGPNQQLTAADFPLHRLENPADRESKVLFDTNDVVSSQGTFGGDFLSIAPAGGAAAAQVGSVGPVRHIGAPFATTPIAALVGNENCNQNYDPVSNPFHANALIFRKVEPRQTPTTINAVFNFRQFWDGRANNQFNGVDPFGARTFKERIEGQGPGNPNARRAGTLVGDPTTPSVAALRLEQILIENASLASQAVGPPLSDFEMSCAKKSFADLGRKLLPLRALAGQAVHAQDSLLSQTANLIAASPSKGLTIDYRALIEKAFHPKFWAAAEKVRVTDAGGVIPDVAGYTQMEHNFSLFWGLAIQEYESLLISDDSPFDRSMNGDPQAMTEQARAGQMLFLNRANCAGCHFGPLLSGATVTSADRAGAKVIENMPMNNGYTALYDTGFYNIGVRPTIEDPGVGATDPYGFDLSFTRQYKWQLLGQQRRSADPFQPSPCKWQVQYWPCEAVPTGTDPVQSHRDAVDGSFKVPILRNVGLNPPYFHNGGQVSLKDVVRFYSRGGDRRGPLDNDTSGHPKLTPFGQINTTNLDPDIGEALTDLPTQNNALGLSEAEMDDLVQFLLSLTDERVACHSGVFDHPELPLVIGQKPTAVVGRLLAQDIISVMPAVGRSGLKASGKPCFPNSGDLFGSVNVNDPTPLQATFQQILTPVSAPSQQATAPAFGGGTPPGAGIFLNGGIQRGAPNTQTPPLGVPAGAAVVVVPPPPPLPAPVFSSPLTDIKGFTAIGFLQNATVSDDLCKGLPPSRWGGTAVINGINIVIPCNTVLQMPATTFTWADLFDPAKFFSSSYQPASLGLSEVARRHSEDQLVLPSVEIRVEGNIVGGRHIAGLVYISQQSLNTGTAVITGFDYAHGVIFVSGPIGAKVRLQINDPNGRFSAAQSPDSRFSVDSENPTIRSVTGYPMCVPRSDPSRADDPLCPQRNRPLVANGCRNFGDAGIFLPTGLAMMLPRPDVTYCSAFVMKAPLGTPVTTALPADQIAKPSDPDSRQQAPLEIGDLITYSGTLLAATGRHRDHYARERMHNGADLFSVHTITASVGIFTQPGTLPVYLAIGEFRVGAFEPVLLFNGVPQEVPDRIVLEAAVTDVTSIVDIYLVDVDPVTGKQSQRWVTPGSMTSGVGAIGSNGHLIDGGITTQLTGPQPGRVRIRANNPVRDILTSPTRYARVVARSLCDPANVNDLAPLIGRTGVRIAGAHDTYGVVPRGPRLVPCLQRAPAANGLFTGQYMAPNFNFIFPENLMPGDPVVPNNFWSLGFLVNGEGPGTGGLTPTPW